VKSLIEEFFKKKNFFIFTPRLHSFGGSFESLAESLKIANYMNKKIILCIPFFNLHGKHKVKKIFALDLISNIFGKISLIEKTLTIFFTLFLNFCLLLKMIKIRGVLKKIVGIDLINRFLPLYLGYNGLDNNNYFVCESSLWNKILIKKVNYSKKNEEDQRNSAEKKIISLYVKDANYSKVSEISLTSISNIENYRDSLEYIINKGFKIFRLGDTFSQNFVFNHDSFKDLTKSKNYNLNLQYATYEKSEFFFGSNTPGILIAIFFDKKRIITNVPAQYSNNTFSLSKENFSIFKKVFSIKKKRILSIEEILSDKNLFIDEISLLRSSKDYVLIENSPDEILNICKAFINFNYKNIKEDQTLLNQYLEIRSLNVDKLFKNSSSLTKLSSLKKYRYSVLNIPKSFLEKYLFNSKYLEEESKIISRTLDI